MQQHPDLFTPGHIYVLDRNFFSVELVEAIHARGQGAHLVMRMKAGIRLPVVQPDAREPDRAFVARVAVR